MAPAADTEYPAEMGSAGPAEELEDILEDALDAEGPEDVEAEEESDSE